MLTNDTCRRHAWWRVTKTRHVTDCSQDLPDEDTVFVSASENKCFFTSPLLSVLTVAELLSLQFVSHSVWPGNTFMSKYFFVRYKIFSYNLNQTHSGSLEIRNFRPSVNWT